MRRVGGRSLCFSGVLAVICAALAAGPVSALADAPLTWSAPFGVDEHAPFTQRTGLPAVSCPTATACVAAGRDGVVLASTNPAAAAPVWRRKQLPTMSLLTVSCATVSLCAAAGDDGSVFVSSNATGASPVWRQALAGSRSIFAVACAAPATCIAADSDGLVHATANATAAAPAWTSTTVTDSAGHPIDRFNGFFQGAACASATFCALTTSSGDVLVSGDPVDGTAGAWRATRLGDFSVRRIACPTAALCVAVDDGGNVLASTSPGAASPAWRTTALQNGGKLSGVSCAQTSLCMIVDASGATYVSADPGAAAPTWRPGSIPVEPSAGVGSVSCPTTGLCVAVDSPVLLGTYGGNAYTTPNPGAGAGATWKRVNVHGYNSINGLDCPSASLCVAGDGRGRFISSANPSGGPAAWRADPERAEPAGPEVTDLDCASASLCAATRRDGSVAVSTAPTTAGSWKGTPISDEILDGIACPSTTLCLAVDYGGQVHRSTNPAAAQPVWTAVNVRSPDGSEFLKDVECPSPSLCVIVDDSGSVITSTNPGSANPTWTRASVAPESRSTNGLADVSCPTATLCVAVGGLGYVVTSGNPAGGMAAWHGFRAEQEEFLTSLSCSGPSLCVAGDSAGRFVTTTDPTGGAPAWSLVDGPARDDSGITSTITGLSCPAATMCVAVDFGGRATIGTPGRSLNVVRQGAGSGTVTGPGIDCGDVCAGAYADGKTVTLTAEPRYDATFAGWSGACSGRQPSCTVTMSAARSVVARFEPTVYLTLSRSGTGTLTAGGTNCSETCSVAFARGDVVAVTAQPGPGSEFGSWGGACSGTGDCTVTMNGNKTVEAQFVVPTGTLSVTLAGTGAGNVSGGGLTCPPGCTDTGPKDREVTLVAAPAGGSEFKGWSGACSGTGTCRITYAGNPSVTATFDRRPSPTVTPTPTPDPTFTPGPGPGAGPGPSPTPGPPVPGPGDGTGPSEDRTGPVVVVPAANKSLTASRAGTVRFRIGPVEENTTGVLSLKSAGKVRVPGSRRKAVLRLGTAALQALDGQTVAVKVRLGAKARKALAKLKRVRAEATITLRDGRGNATVRRYRLTLKAPRPRGKRL